jgi:Helix-turn-helix domain
MSNIPFSDHVDESSSLSDTGFPPPLTNLYYSVRETRRLLGDISHATAYRLIAAGKLDARKIGAKTVITGQSIGKLAAVLPPVGAR